MEERDASVVATLKAIRDALRPIGRRRVLMAGLAVSALFGSGMLLLGGFSLWWTSQPSFCNRCHVMEPFIDAWEESPHGDVNCEMCHTSPGFFGFMGGKIAGLQVVVNYARGRYEDWSFNAAVPNASCLRCHEPILEEDVHGGAGELIVSHRDIIENGAKCISCHATTAHGESVPIGAQTHPTMAACLACHDDDTAPLDCNLCHTGRERPSDHPPDDGEEPQTEAAP